MAASTFQLFFITETWLLPGILDKEVVAPGYNLLRCDRSGKSRGGGVAIVTPALYDLRGIDTELDNKTGCDCELVCGGLYRNNNLLFVVVCVYIPPTASEAQYFAVFKSPPKLNVDEAMAAASENSNNRIHIQCILSQDINIALKKLKPKRSAGPDGNQDVLIYKFHPTVCVYAPNAPLHGLRGRCCASGTAAGGGHRCFNVLLTLSSVAFAFWDSGTTTPKRISKDLTPRQSFFRWERVESLYVKFWYSHFDWDEINDRRKLYVFAGLSIDFIPLGTAILLGKRVLITSANFLEPYLTRQRDVRIWALGRAGKHVTPYRYRVWRFRRLIPRSNNPEHWHGPRGIHVPRHDISVVHSFDQIYIHDRYSPSHEYAFKGTLCQKDYIIEHFLWYGGSGFIDLEHIRENYKIKYARQFRDEIVDCSNYLPKWWGKFICIKNKYSFAGTASGGGLFSGPERGGPDLLIGLGCFEIRYNEDRILVFTDLRYYIDRINIYANITPGEYYEYAYPEYSITYGWLYDDNTNHPYIPTWHIKDDMFPLGRR
ncbi:uncharacterized protein LOC131845451 [Achroia grisella]|uniref:uncharacterized protein LOC131845451 n=1 Tax=Achroia grisella TaxID=688607 RepID=UPI0027D24681|nr:uncharacterized protein LOC131845451 [Achroia grisella]